MFEISLDRITWLHRIPAGVKLAVLALAGAAVFLIGDHRVLGGFVAVAVLLPLSARLPLKAVLRQCLPAAILIALLAAFHVLTGEPDTAIEVSARLATVILLAVTLTLTTRVSAMVEAIETAARPLRFVGVDPAKVGLTLTLAIRFIPVLFALVGEIREAQKARGLEGNIIAVVMPLLVRTLKMADDLADAIAARGYDAE